MIGKRFRKCKVIESNRKKKLLAQDFQKVRILFLQIKEPAPGIPTEL